MSVMKEQLAAFTKSMEDRGLMVRSYDEEALLELYQACGVVWKHMTRLDHGNLSQWNRRHIASLANAWSEGNASVDSWSALSRDGCRGNRTFPEAKFGIDCYVAHEAAAHKAFDAKGGVGSTHATATYKCECGYEASSATEVLAHVKLCSQCTEKCGVHIPPCDGGCDHDETHANECWVNARPVNDPMYRGRTKGGVSDEV